MKKTLLWATSAAGFVMVPLLGGGFATIAIDKIIAVTDEPGPCCAIHLKGAPSIFADISAQKLFDVFTERSTPTW